MNLTNSGSPSLSRSGPTSAPSEHVGNGAGDVLDFTPITGGTVDGPRLRGVVVPGGGDWSVQRGPTVYELDARYLDPRRGRRAHRHRQPRLLPHGHARRPWSGRRPARTRSSEVYFRTSPVFRTDAPQHRWLAETVFVGLARDEAGQVCIRFYEVL